jgi:plastocyanin
MHPRLYRALPALVLTLALAAAIVAGCSSNDSGAPPIPPTSGPTFSFAFPATGTAAVPGTSNRRFFTAAEVGSWNYRCIPHGSGGMTGTVNVVAGSANDSAFVQVGPSNAFAFSPSTVTIDTGGYVRWANVSNMSNHTVTRP